MPRRAKSDTTEGKVAKNANLKANIPVPEGINFRNEEEKLVYDQFAKSRALDLWREFDLLLLYKAARLECDVRNYQAALEIEGISVLNKRGTPVVNPLVSVIDTYERRLLGIIRTLSLGVSADTARDLNKSGTTTKDAEDLKKIKEGKVVHLLAN